MSEVFYLCAMKINNNILLYAHERILLINGLF